MRPGFGCLKFIWKVIPESPVRLKWTGEERKSSKGCVDEWVTVGQKAQPLWGFLERLCVPVFPPISACSLENTPCSQKMPSGRRTWEAAGVTWKLLQVSSGGAGEYGGLQRVSNFAFWSILIIPFGEGNGIPLQYSCLENPMDRGAWWAAVHGVTKSQKRLSDFTFTFHFYALEKEMVTHSSVLAWRIPGTGEPGGLWSMGSHRVGHYWSNLAAAASDHTLMAENEEELKKPLDESERGEWKKLA